MSSGWIALVVLVGLALAVGAAAGLLVVQGAITLDVQIGRRTRALGPLRVGIAAPREAVFDLLALPYVSPNPPKALRDKVTVLERGADMVLAAHRTRVGPLTTTTVETVVLERPHAIAFRLVRGPVAEVVERFELSERERGTELLYTGHVGSDFWLAGSAWSWLVARRWGRAVAESLAVVKESAERGQTRTARRPPP